MLIYQIVELEMECNKATYSPPRKQLFSVFIQGKHAPQYWLKHCSGQLLRAEVQSIVLGEVLLVSSMYRSEIIYKSPAPQNEIVIQLWHAFVRKPYNRDFRRHFYQTFNDQETIENHFFGMLDLSRKAQWFEDYKEEINKTARLEPNHSIIKVLKACEKFLMENRAYLQFRQPVFDLDSPGLPSNKVLFKELLTGPFSSRPQN